MQLGAIADNMPTQYRETSHQAGGDGNNHLVHQACLEETGNYLAAAFHHYASDAPLAKLLQQMRQLHSAKKIRVAADDFCSPTFNNRDSLRVTSIDTGHPAPMVGVLKQPCPQRDAQFTVENDWLGVCSLGKTNSQLGVVDHQGIDPDDNGIAGGANAMGQDHGLMTAQAKRFSIPGGNTAIQTLGIGYSDQWSVVTFEELPGQKRELVKPYILVTIFHRHPLAATQNIRSVSVPRSFR
jgi:hypothetical protein